jgi:pyruvate dehydrogenase (quinone)/pyruvate oxidase
MATVAEYLVDQLAAWGVRHIYGVAGDTVLPLLDAIARRGSIRYVPVRHEAAAGFMASAEAKLTGRPGACLATSGPGLANLMNGLADAWADRVPVVAVTGQVATGQIGTMTKQYMDQQAWVRPLAGFTALLASPAAAAEVVSAALRTAVGEGRVGHISVPTDLFPAPCPAKVVPPEPYLGAPPVPDPSVTGAAAARMAGAARPLILIGQGAVGAREAILQLAERWGAGIVASLPARVAVPWSHPLVLGGLGHGGSDAAHTALQEADLLLALGCNWWPAGFVPDGLPVVKVDRIPAQIGGPMPVSYGIAGDVGRVVGALLGQMGADRGAGQAGGSVGGPGGNGARRPDWQARLTDLKRAWEATLGQETAPAAPISPQHAVRALEQALPPDAVIALDTGDHTVWFGRAFRGERQTVLLSGRWRSLGFGVPAALAARLAAPDRTAVALVGDTGLQSLLGELVTAAELALPVTIVVLNNGQMAIERNRAAARGLAPLGTAPRCPDFAAVARACGLAAWQARTPGDLAEALAAALRAGGPALVEVFTTAPVAPTATSS